MSDYLLGLATIPAMLLGYVLAVAIVSRTIVALGRVHLGILRRIRPDDERMTRERRAAVLYGLRSGVVYSLGEFVLVVGHGLDEDRRTEASLRLLRRIDIFDREARDDDDA